jgi:Ca-activated chloride channel family protein
MQSKPGDLADNRSKYTEGELRREIAQQGQGGAGRGMGRGGAGGAPAIQRLQDALDRKESLDRANEALRGRQLNEVQSGKLGVDLSVGNFNLRNQERLTQTAQKQANGRNCIEVGGVWIDEGFDPKKPTVTVKAMSDAYFRILERQPQVREVFQMGNHLAWVTPNGTNLVIDSSQGQEKLADDEIDRLFVAAK